MRRRARVVNSRGNSRNRVYAAITVACLFAVVMTAQDQPRKYDLKLAWKTPVEGHKSELSQDESQVMMMKLLDGDGNVLKQHEDKQVSSFAAVEMISKVTDAKTVVSRWTFTKATQRRGEKDEPYSFQGRTVVVTDDPPHERQFTFDNGEPVSTEDLAVLAKLWDSDTKPGQPSGEEIFAPKTPVAVGEPWVPDIPAIARGIGIGDDIDLKKSTAKATLKSTETRSGAEFGDIELLLNLWVTKIGPIQLESPVLMKLEADINVCIDGTLPDGIMTLTMEGKGDSFVSAGDPPKKMQIFIETEMKMIEGDKSVK